MTILAIDTSGPVCGVCVYENSTVRYEGSAVNKLTHSVNMMPMVEEALKRSGLSLGQIELFAAVMGPGSFTGVRIGISAVRALAHAENKPCIGIDALGAMAQGVSLSSYLLCPIQDARAGQVYGAVFTGDNGIVRRLSDDVPMKLEDFCLFAEKLASPGQRLLFLGDGLPVHRSQIESILGEKAAFAPANVCYLRASSAAMLAHAHAAEAGDCFSLKPLYLRPPQAERQRNLLELGHE